MSKKPKFKPEITRVKLNPEQAVLACMCYDVGRPVINYTQWTGWQHGGGPGSPRGALLCIANTKDHNYVHKAWGGSCDGYVDPSSVDPVTTSS